MFIKYTSTPISEHNVSNKINPDNIYTLSWKLTLYNTSSARNGNLEVPVSFLKPKQGYTVRKMEKDEWI
jgi:hypothetical protein